MSDTAILFTGLIHPNIVGIVFHKYFTHFINSTSDIKAIKFASIWDNTDDDYVEMLIENDFIVIKNDIHEKKLYNSQNIPIVNGLKFIKENYSDIEFVLRTRFDILSYDYNTYLEKARHLYSDKITVLCGIHTSITYFLDIIVSGRIDEMRQFYTLQITNDTRPPEVFLLETYLNKASPSKEDIRKYLSFSLNICIENGIEFIWIRPYEWAGHSRTIPNMKVIEEYCTESTQWI